MKEKSTKSGKSKKSKSSKSKKSKREVASALAPPKSGQAQPPSSSRLAVEAEKRAADKASKVAAAKLAHDSSVKSASTQRSVSVKQPGSGAVADNNNPGDSTRELKMEPAELRWSTAGGMQKISLLNQSAERQAIKVKCSDNNVYRVNPVYAFVEPGQTLNVDVMRQNGSNKVDKIVFVTAKVS